MSTPASTLAGTAPARGLARVVWSVDHAAGEVGVAAHPAEAGEVLDRVAMPARSIPSMNAVVLAATTFGDAP